MTDKRIPSTVRRACAVTVVLALAVSLGGCGRLFGGRVSRVETPSEPPGITGAITKLEPARNNGVVALVEASAPPTSSAVDKAQVTIPGETNIAYMGRWIPAGDLTVGMKVRVWFKGGIAESYPIQGTAGFVEVVGQ